MKTLSEDRSRRAIALVLRYGSLISTLIMALGLILTLLRTPALARTSHSRIGLGQLIPRLVHLDPLALTECGILLLLLTPIFRILVAMASFAMERDHKYVWISLGVLAVVLLSISFAIAT